MKLTVNGKARVYKGPPFKRLLDALREDFGLTGAKEGCGEGECGACTVIVGGKPVNSCLVPMGQMEGASVETVEGLASGGRPSRLQACFLETGGAQCGICTPGMLMSAEVHRRARGAADHRSVCEAVSGNLCRCTGYKHIVEAVTKALKPARRKAAR